MVRLGDLVSMDVHRGKRVMRRRNPGTQELRQRQPSATPGFGGSRTSCPLLSWVPGFLLFRNGFSRSYRTAEHSTLFSRCTPG